MAVSHDPSEYTKVVPGRYLGSGEALSPSELPCTAAWELPVSCRTSSAPVRANATLPKVVDMEVIAETIIILPEKSIRSVSISIIANLDQTIVLPLERRPWKHFYRRHIHNFAKITF